MGPIKFLSCRRDFVVAQGCAVGCGGAFLIGGTVANYRFAGYERWFSGLLGGFNGGGDGAVIVPVYPGCLPSASFESHQLVVADGHIGRSVDGDVVIVKQ
jgi:hypothetical protein